VKRSEFLKKVKQASDVELETMLRQEQENLYKMRQQIALKQLSNPNAIKSAKKNIARIRTEIRLRQLARSKGS
jgi:large subunit ribosomal protein L29